MFYNKFGKVIYEGYGTTELTPVASAIVQTYRKARHKVETIGQVVPGDVLELSIQTP